MTPERWREVKRVFADALERKPEERSAYLAQVCAESELRREVELMIGAHERAGSRFMEAPTQRLGDNEPLKSQTKLGPYEILTAIGRGGMGEVYRARDLKLGRDVAIKVLPSAFASDPERLLRFQREARTLASLNHPNIAAIYGLEDSGGKPALIMELVEGLTLADRVKCGPLPLDESLRIAQQIAEALESAHSHQIVHRDLKPANVKVTPSGRVKVLDFGLAKALTGESWVDISLAPSQTGETTEGAILGTPAYASPEQVRGKRVDRRTDIWAFGCVLYELLTAQRAFPGETLPDAIAAVLDKEPDWQALPPRTPEGIRDLLRRCLQKDREHRLRDLGDGLIEIEHVRTASHRRAPASTEPEGSFRRIAVLPFVNETADLNKEHLSDGMTDSLIGALCQLPGLKVMAHSTVFRYKGTRELPQTVGQELQVSAVLVGRLTDNGHELSIQLDLIDVTDGTELWGARYARELADIAQLQGAIVRDISARLRIHLGANEQQRLDSAGTRNSEAYRLYLQGRQLWYGRTSEGLRQSISLFRQAIVADSHYALAYAGLADTYSVAPSYHIGITVQQAHILADEASRKALELDNSLPEARLARAIALSHSWRWLDAETEYQRILELNPNNADAHYFYAFLFLVSENRIDEALDEFGIALSLDPLSPIVNTNYAVTLMIAHRYREAFAQFERALELEPDLEAAHLKLSLLHATTGKFAEAMAELQKYAPTPGPWSVDARGYNELLMVAVPKQLDWQAYAALSFALCGDSDKSFECLDKAYSNRDMNLLACVRFPALDAFRSDRRYANLMRSLGLPE